MSPYSRLSGLHRTGKALVNIPRAKTIEFVIEGIDLSRAGPSLVLVAEAGPAAHIPLEAHSRRVIAPHHRFVVINVPAKPGIGFCECRYVKLPLAMIRMGKELGRD